jgi:hypothetical protein
MKQVHGWLVLSSALVVVALVASPVHAQKTRVKFTKEWSGSVADEKLMKDAPQCVTSKKGLENLWKAWKISDKMPEVDFDKEIVVIGVTSGSKLRLGASINEKGNLEVLGLGTSDLAPGFRYVMGTVSKEGVKTVNGKELPKE